MLDTNFAYIGMICIAALFIASVISVFRKKRREQFIASTVLFALVIIAAAYLFIQNYNATLFGIFHIYPFSALFILLFSTTMLLINILSYPHAKDYHDLSLLLSLSFAGMLIVATAVSILEIFIGLELMAITTSFMILFEGKHRVEAAVKFFILASVSIAILSFAIVLLFPYNSQLTLTPAVKNHNLSGTYLILLSIALFAAAFGFDAALFPFNLWIPDVYEGAPTYITSMLAGINKKVAFVAMIEVFFFVFIAYQSTFSMILVILSILTMFFGNLMALVQKDVKRLFAYSSISQAGYILIGISTATRYGIEASIFYIIAHSFMIIGTFALILWLESNSIKTVEDYTALNSRNKFAATSLTILMLSMAGIPPLIGFAGKFLLFSSAISANLVWLAVIGIINSFISVYYYGRLINAIYSRKESKAIKLDIYVAMIVVITLGVVIIFGLYPQALISVALKAVSSLGI